MEIFKFVFSPIDVNTYILADRSGACAIIDCGCYDRIEFRSFTDFLNEKGLKPELLLNTHCHLDHIFGNGMLLKEYDLRTLSHIDEEKNRKDSEQHAMFFGLQMETPPEPGGFLSEGEELKFGNVTLKVLHVPGHSPGSLAFYSSEYGVVFTGDALFAGSIGRTDLPGGNHEALIESIRNKLFILPPETQVYPGHGETTTIGEEIRTNPFFTGKDY
jgi:hydroxyacylglutathione hydrolase